MCLIVTTNPMCIHSLDIDVILTLGFNEIVIINNQINTIK